MSAARATIGIVIGLLIIPSAGTLSASAADYAGAVSRLDSVWLGHFTGGRNLAPGVEPTALDWADRYERFGSLRDCASWVRDLTHAYATYQGYKTCVRIR